ncbi:esterase/lipase family protein [Acerihabitans arboris]|uniref:GPI inositol-deacylase PGAP1-like alpha/beta domain-containing protein n=1 Tax=Acerihabitans arboris TaxID=2691583 RepID=A0A845SLS5_9GAMM|nr:hypothetical protein [Acerihabitans arboris]NDL64187.1 hypothetical protein [Acerihabitans arboris]
MTLLTENEVVVLPEYDTQGRPYYNIPNARADHNLVAVCPKVADKVIPVIFLPGVMGTNLKNGKDKRIWHANLYQGVDALKWIKKGAVERKLLLDPANTDIDNDGFIHFNEQEGTMFPSREQRGWGTALFKNYGESLHILQLMLNDGHILLDNLFHGTRRLTTRQQLIGEKLGVEQAQKEEQCLTEPEVRHSYDFLFPLHVFGYNWLQSNAESATRLGDYIAQVLGMYHGRLAMEKVILITHSMGGLVARHYSENMGGRENILGIVHGVMPDLGSPATYRRMKTGERGIVGAVIGPNAEALMPVLAQSPGPLQLLPGTAYGPGWLKIQNGNKIESWPVSDPYSEIYLNKNDWWRLYDAGISGGRPEVEWNKFEKIITNKVKNFIEGLSNKYHPQTWIFYGASEKKPSDEYLIWRERQFQRPVYGRPILQFPTYRQATGKTFELTSSGSPGDGTVPVKGGKIALHQLRGSLATDVDHEGAYNAGNIAMGGTLSVAMKFTLYSVVKMVREVPPCG